ncbi:hypothetical protein [Streptomyces sp. YIM B13518]|uniref:DUF7919 family protein n=1 Tax=Streptomyces sp. YIM B13518 TaxID=3366316 RepID=UPI0036C6A55B
MKSPFVFLGDAYDAFTGQNGGAGAFVDKYLPVRPAYRLYRAEYMLRQQGCDALADLHAETAEELTQRIALVGIGGPAGDTEVWLGSAEIRVQGADGTRYAAPNLVIHCMTAHHYCPPEEFCRAAARTAGIETAGEPTLAD